MWIENQASIFCLGHQLSISRYSYLLHFVHLFDGNWYHENSRDYINVPNYILHSDGESLVNPLQIPKVQISLC